MTTAIKQPRHPWAYEEMEAEYEAGRATWFEVSEGFYYQALNVLPPVYAPGGFLVGEPWNHNRAGQAILAAFVKTGERYFGTMSTKAAFVERRAELMKALGEES